MEEQITANWVKSEYQQGHYRKGNYLIQGKMQKGFEVNSNRDLMRAD